MDKLKKYLKWCATFLTLLLIAGCNNEEQPDAGDNETTVNESTEWLEGGWSGAIEVPGQPLHIEVAFASDESLTGTISIPVQGLESYPLSDIQFEGDEISFIMALPNEDVMFDGEVIEDSISGTFTQSGQSFPFELGRGEESDQSSKEEEEFLTIEIGEDTLYGSLVLPEEGDGYPVALIIPGSGPTDRNGNSPNLPGENNSLKLMAEALAENGIASLRYDKRGAGKNAQAVTSEEDMDFDQFVKDAEQWITLLEEDDRFTNIVVLGHSQGSLEGMIASADTSVDAFISVAGAGRPIDEVLLEQLESLSNELYRESQAILESLKQGDTVEEVNEQLLSVFRPSVQPFMISWMNYDPVEQIQKLDTPALIINGTHDIQVPEEDAEKLAEAKSGSELLLIEGMNHVLKDAPADEEENMKTYSDPTLPLADGLMPEILTFLKDNHLLDE